MWLLERNSPALGSYVFQANVIIFKIIQDIIKKNRLSKFHKDRPIDVASRVLTRKNARPMTATKNPPPLGSHVFQAKVTIFELLRDIIETNLLTKFHKDWTINVASRELTRQMLTAHNTPRTKGDHKSSL
ncbi:hypothetical protein DPMN_163272 [Dreissena polymorpha]|uniref:Uncharacterized protein n=1 Tax=Dreissena polymorpha TaxID=45954 RepID=A0A9D4ERT3_DREPO|nr:hypothetical protein DPMN_163272 [Dreissena polymorpha]